MIKMKFEITSYPSHPCYSQHLIPIEANSIPQLLFQNLASHCLPSAITIAAIATASYSSNVYEYPLQIARILPCRRLTSKKKRLENRLQTYRTIAVRRSPRESAANQPRTLPPPRKKAILSGCLVTRRDRPLELLRTTTSDEWKKGRIRRSVVSFVDVTVQTSFP